MPFSIVRQRVLRKSLLEYAKINRNEGSFNDVTITAGNESIPANRLILSCYSVYFEKMFKSNMRERYENVIKIEAIEGQSLKTLVDYIYSGSIDINNENVMSLLSGADYLQLDDVKQFCFDILQTTITPNTAFSILEAASLYKNDDLKNHAQRYISTNLNEVAQTDAFKSFLKAQIIEFISNLDHNKAKSTSVYQAIITWIYHRKKRKVEFPELFKMVNLNSMGMKVLEETVLEEKLVENSLICQKLALKAYRMLLSQQKMETSETKLLSVGGTWTQSKVMVVFDLLDEKPKPEFPDMMQGLEYHSSLKLKDYLYAIGGQVNGMDTNNVCRLNLKNQHSKWEQVASMNGKRSMMGAAVYKDTMVVCGGEDGKLKSTEAYLTKSDEWKALSLMNQGRYDHSVVVCDEFLYALGGYFSTDYLSSAEKLENLIGDWKHVKEMQTPRRHLAAVYCDGAIYAIGGTSGEGQNKRLKTVEKYDFAANQWDYVKNMDSPRTFHAASVLQGKIYVVGGIDNDGNIVKEIECYDPKNDTWSVVGETADKLFRHALVTV